MVPLRQPVGFGTAIGTRPRTVRVLFTGRVGAMTRFIMRCCRICRNSRIAPSCQFVRFDAMRGREVDPPPKHHKCSPCGAPENAQTIHINVFKNIGAYTASPRRALPTYLVFLRQFSVPKSSLFSGHGTAPRFWAQIRAQILGAESRLDSRQSIASSGQFKFTSSLLIYIQLVIFAWKLGALLCPESGRVFMPRIWAHFYAQNLGTVPCPENGLEFGTENWRRKT
jgi:hypothetical protein